MICHKKKQYVVSYVKTDSIILVHPNYTRLQEMLLSRWDLRFPQQ
jgi:hypothetical protein